MMYIQKIENESSHDKPSSFSIVYLMSMENPEVFRVNKKHTSPPTLLPKDVYVRFNVRLPHMLSSTYGITNIN